MRKYRKDIYHVIIFHFIDITNIILYFVVLAYSIANRGRKRYKLMFVIIKKYVF